MYRFLLFILLCAGLTYCAAPPATDSATDTAPAIAPPAPRPNIVFIMSDDHAQRAISAYTDELIETPNLDRIANDGMLFRNSFVTNSICAPSRAAILTGKYSHLNGKIDNLSPFDPDQWTFPEALHEAGYRTALIGKHHLQARPRGIDEFRGLIGQGSYYAPVFVHNGDTLGPESGYTSDIITDYALAELQRNAAADQPFLLMYWHKAPHRNWMPDTASLPGLLDQRYPEPATLRDDYAGRPRAEHADMRIADMFTSHDLKVTGTYQNPDPGTGGATFIKDPTFDQVKNLDYQLSRLQPDERAAWAPFLAEVGRQWQQVKGTDEELSWRYQRYMQDYLASVKSVDRNVGRVLDYLEESGLAENTLVIYTSDQGFYLGEHGWYDKRFMYEESHRTPLMIRYPALIDAGSTIDELVLNIDLAPTLLELAGVPVPGEVQGRSLLPLFSDPAPADWRDEIYYRYYQQMDSYHRVARHEGVRDERYKLIHFTEPGFEGYELYDLEQDPHELENRIDDQQLAEQQERLKDDLARLRRELRVAD
ncbi:N-acetylglucosamine-6-O-sulfatase [Neolewinella maritima]|uniref:N-acetylglucosamine-6-O-sulfatase n=1 Tax=Neolewinella maritima TaxID=1383882 RepID=A0ABM9AWH2_9BACT|nr:sulfatase [Neolewinella maritima]CAH0998792.1 N-acetylglucosamine-6-O-sulfatase [Neolewinella maritima]